MKDHNITEEFNLLDILMVLAERKKLIGAIVLLFTLIGSAISFTLPRTYMAKSVIMPLEDGGGDNLYSSRTQEFQDELGFGFDRAKPRERLMTLLKSRTLAERVIEKYDLIPVLLGKKEMIKERRAGGKEELMENAVEALLRKHVLFGNVRGKGIVEISAEFDDPELGVKVLNGYLDELNKIVNEYAFASANRNRLFIQRQLAQNQKELLLSGKKMAEFYNDKKISNSISSMDVNIGPNFFLDMFGLSGSNDDNLGILLKKKEGIDSVLVVKDVPQQVYLQYLVIQRELLQKINILLDQQYEVAKMEEAKNSLSFEVIDPPNVSWIKSSPDRASIIVLFFLVSLYVGMVAAFLADYAERVRKCHSAYAI